MEKLIMSLQEKFQVIFPTKANSDNPGPWKSFESARDTRGAEEWCNERSCDVDMRQFNKAPAGMDIGEQDLSEQNPMPLSLAGASDVSRDTNATALRQGFVKKDMGGADDCYTGEHIDQFYGDSGGFAERNNYLDRL
jgi:hypothetical protein